MISHSSLTCVNAFCDGLYSVSDSDFSIHPLMENTALLAIVRRLLKSTEHNGYVVMFNNYHHMLNVYCSNVCGQ